MSRTLAFLNPVLPFVHALVTNMSQRRHIFVHGIKDNGFGSESSDEENEFRINTISGTPTTVSARANHSVTIVPHINGRTTIV